MLKIYGAAASLAVATLVIGCSAQPPAAPMAAAPVAAASTTASASGGFDGVYRGPEGGTSGNSQCMRKLGNPIRVTNGVASFSTAVTGVMEGPVGPDGSLSIQHGRASLIGQFANGMFTGNYGSGNCTYALKYAKG